MSDVLVLEFEADSEAYNKVNSLLGIDPSDGGGDWPAGLLDHVGAGGDGRVVVVEIWDSKDSQAKFMESRLGPALAEAGMPQPTRMQWMALLGHHAD